MIRKVLGSILALALFVGVAVAAEIEAIFKKYEDGKLTATVTVKEKNPETGKLEEVQRDKTYKLYDRAKVKLSKKGEQLASDFLKSAKSGMPMKLYIDEATITEIAIERKKKKK